VGEEKDMEKKILCILVMTLLIATAVPVMGFEERNEKNLINYTENKKQDTNMVSDILSSMADSSTETTNDVVGIGGIRGGMRVSAVVINTGDIPIGDIEWKFEFEGLIFIGPNSGTITSLEPYEQTIIHSRIVVGIGRGYVRVTAGDTDKTANFLTFGMMIYVFPN